MLDEKVRTPGARPPVGQEQGHGLRQLVLTFGVTLSLLAGMAGPVDATPALIGQQTKQEVEVSIEVGDDSLRTTMVSRDGSCRYYRMDIVDERTGSRVANKRAKYCHDEVTWKVGVSLHKTYRIRVWSSTDKKSYQLADQTHVQAGIGLRPTDGEPSTRMAVTGTVELFDNATWRDTGSFRKFPIQDYVVVGSNVSVRKTHQRCIGMDTSVRIHYVASADGSAVDVDGHWTFWQINRNKLIGKRCYHRVQSGSEMIDELVKSGESEPVVVKADGGGNRVYAKLAFSNLG